MTVLKSNIVKPADLKEGSPSIFGRSPSLHDRRGRTRRNVSYSRVHSIIS